MIVDAILSPAEIALLPQKDLSKTLCVVFDILRATSSMVTALAHGTHAIRPVSTIEEAWAAREEWPGAILGGERHGDRIDGFDLGNSPFEYAKPGQHRIITTTTNGTVALRACDGAGETLVGAFLNMSALETYLQQKAPEQIALVCAGTGANVALEDVLAAGRLASVLGGAELTDAARVASALYDKHRGSLGTALACSENGRVLLSRGRDAEVAWCARLSEYPSVLGVLRNGEIRPVAAGV